MPSDPTTKIILIVDDEPASIVLLSQLLPPQHQLLGATDGPTALDLAAAHRPDLILLDVRMPGMDGFAVCQALQQTPETAAIPVIFLTALVEAEAAVHGLSLGAVACLTKPITASALLASLDTYLP
jgi:putative two-component system response regulator